jgi:DHA1 family bicyclomycin/chloramphenicol resistance-like MFS transporter
MLDNIQGVRTRLIGRPGDQNTVAVVLFGAAIFGLLPISTDLYLPALPAIRAAFADSGSHVQLTLSAFILGFGIAHLFTGPLSDRYGRRPLLLSGVGIYLLASLGCALASSVTMLICFRALQGLGACSGSVMSRAIVRDLYEPQRGAHVFSLIALVFTIVPMFGPLIGGWLTAWFGWRATFAFQLAVSLLVLAATWRLLDETNRHLDASATDPARLVGNYGVILRNPGFLGYTLSCMFSYTGVFTYLSLSSFVLFDAYGVPASRFGLWFMLGVCGHACGALACNRLVRSIAMPKLVVISSSITALGAASMLVLVWSGLAHPLAIMGPMVLYLFGHGITSPLCMMGAVGPFPRLAGTASALFGFIQSAVAAVVGQVAMRFYNGTGMTLAGITLISALCLVVTAAAVAFRGQPAQSGSSG